MLVLAGTIGAGKSSLTEILANHLGTKAFYEPVEDNPVLDLYYKDPSKYAFLLQIYFLNKRFESIKAAYRENNNVLDRSIFEDALFLNLNYKNGNVTKPELDIYNSLLANMMEEMENMPKKSPDLLIYLDVSFETMLDHIEKRGRDFEQTSEDPALIEYCRQVHAGYPEWFENYHHSAKIKIDVNKYDFVNCPEDREEVLRLIDDKLKELNLKGN